MGFWGFGVLSSSKMSFLKGSVLFPRLLFPNMPITSRPGMEKVATSIRTEVTEVALFGSLTLNRGTCTIIYIPLIMPQTRERAPFITMFMITLAPVAACNPIFPLFCRLFSF